MIYLLVQSTRKKIKQKIKIVDRKKFNENYLLLSFKWSKS